MIWRLSDPDRFQRIVDSIIAGPQQTLFDCGQRIAKRGIARRIEKTFDEAGRNGLTQSELAELLGIHPSKLHASLDALLGSKELCVLTETRICDGCTEPILVAAKFMSD